MSDSNEEVQKPPPSSDAAASQIPKAKPSGIKPPSSSSASLSSSSAASSHRVSRICSGHHDKKPELPLAATPTKLNVSEESEYDLLYDRFGLGFRSSKSKSQSPDSFRLLYKYSPDRKSSSGISSISPDFFEATGRRSSSDHGADLTTDTDSFMIGNRVYVGGVKPGRITFIGEVHFAPGEWAGVVLDEPEGKNDGAVSGKRYFQCEPKKGIFSRLTRLTREPLSSITTTDGPFSSDFSFRSFTSPIRTTSGNTSPTQSVSSVSKTPAAGTKLTPEIGDRVIVKSATGSRVGILRYRGEPAFASGIWCGVEYEEAVGKNDGSVSGQRYFKCEPNHGIFVPEGKVVLSPLARKTRLSRQNSQESLTSNITLGSLASTNTAKLRLSATQKRLSTLNKSPSATSTPKPSFSLQDILREKTNHIEQIMKERDFDREEMAAQTVLYQKSLSQYKEKVTHLQKLLEDERKRSEDLQFTVDEAQTNADENEITLREKIRQLEQAVQQGAAGDFVPVDTSQQDELTKKLRDEIEETKQKLHLTESLKTTLENEVQHLNDRITEYTQELELKTSANDAIEKVFHEEIGHLRGMVGDLEQQLSKKSAEIESHKEELAKTGGAHQEEIASLQRQIKEKTDNETLLQQQIEDKIREISSLNSDVEKLAGSDIGAQEIISKKDSEIQKLGDALQTKAASIRDLSSELEKKIDEVSARDAEIENLQKSLESLQSEHATIRSGHEQAIETNAAEISQQKSQIEAHVLEISSLKSDVQRLRVAASEHEEIISQSQAAEKALAAKITDLSESKVKLENDLISKDKDLLAADEARQTLLREIEEIKRCMSGLNAEAEGNVSRLAVKNSCIQQLTKDFNELKETSQKEIALLATEKASFEARLQAADERFAKEKTDFDNERGRLKVTIEDHEKIIKEKDARLEVMNRNSTLLTESKETLEKSVADLEAKFNDTACKLSKLQLEHNDASSKLDKLQVAHAETTSRLQEAEIVAKQLQEDKNSLMVDNKDLHRKLGTQDEKMAQLSELKSKLEEKLDAYKSSSLDANGELKKLSDSLKENQLAFEAYQANADKERLELHRQVDELKFQRDQSQQTIGRYQSELEVLNQQKIENENLLNTDLQNIKARTEEERAILNQEIVRVNSLFETERAGLRLRLQELAEKSELDRREYEKKVEGMTETMEDLRKELEAARKDTQHSEQRFGSAIDDLKAKEGQVAEELFRERCENDMLKQKIENLEAALKIRKNELVERMAIANSRYDQLLGELKKEESNRQVLCSESQTSLQNLEKAQAECVSYEKEISQLRNQIQNELSSKSKLEESVRALSEKLREIEEEQVDLVHKKEEYKRQTVEQQETINELRQRRSSLDEKLAVAKKESQLMMSESDIKIKDMQARLNDLNNEIVRKEFEKGEIISSLKVRDEQLGQLSDSIKLQDKKLLEEIENIQRQVKAKDNELVQMANDCSTKDEMLAQLQNTVENLKTCLNSMNSEKASSSDAVQELNQTVHSRDATISEITLKLQALESNLKVKDDQLKNIYSLKSQVESESKTRIDDLLEQIALLEEVKSKEFAEIQEKLTQLTTQVNLYQSESETSRASEKDIQRMEQEYLVRIRDLEMSETELQITNQTLKRQLEEMQNTTTVPVPKMESGGGDQDLVEHIEFLNSIIADMHKKNLKLSKQVHSLEVGSSKSSSSFKENDFDLKFLEKKHLPPRMYCDICEIFDAHETEDCPTQCSAVDPDAPAAKREEKERKKPPPRKYCDFCEEFDAHETEECPNSDETF